MHVNVRACACACVSQMNTVEMAASGNRKSLVNNPSSASLKSSDFNKDKAADDNRTGSNMEGFTHDDDDSGLDPAFLAMQERRRASILRKTTPVEILHEPQDDKHKLHRREKSDKDNKVKREKSSSALSGAAVHESKIVVLDEEFEIDSDLESELSHIVRFWHFFFNMKICLLTLF